jgi:hypothetical protein
LPIGGGGQRKAKATADFTDYADRIFDYGVEKKNKNKHGFHGLHGSDFESFSKSSVKSVRIRGQNTPMTRGMAGTRCCDGPAKNNAKSLRVPLHGAGARCALAHNRGVIAVTALVVEEFVHWHQAVRTPGCREEGGSKNTKIGERNHGIRHH